MSYVWAINLSTDEKVGDCSQFGGDEDTDDNQNIAENDNNVNESQHDHRNNDSSVVELHGNAGALATGHCRNDRSL